MRPEEFRKAISGVDERFVDEAFAYEDRRKASKRRQRTFIFLAAAVVLLVGALAGGAALYRAGHQETKPPDVPTTSQNASTARKTPDEPAPGSLSQTESGESLETTHIEPPLLYSPYIGVVQAPINENKAEEDYYFGVLIRCKKTHAFEISATKYTNLKLLQTVNYAAVGLKEALTGALLEAAKQGYLTDERNLIIAQIAESSDVSYDELKTCINEAVEILVEEGCLTDSRRLAGKVDTGQMLYLAKTCGISAGHAKYALQLAEKDRDHSLDELIAMDAETVRRLCDSAGIDTRHPRVDPEKKLDETLAALGLDRREVKIWREDLCETDDMYMAILEFSASGQFCHYDFDALSGCLIRSRTFGMIDEEEAIAFAAEKLDLERGEIARTWVSFAGWAPILSEVSMLNCDVILRCDDGQARYFTFNVEALTDGGSGGAAPVSEQEVGRIVEEDLGISLSDPVRAALYSGSPSLWIACARTGEGMYVSYILNAETGGILYKEAFKPKDPFVKYTVDFAVKAAESIAQLAGGVKIEILGVDDFVSFLDYEKLPSRRCGLIGRVSYLTVRLLADGEEHICLFSPALGGINYR